MISDFSLESLHNPLGKCFINSLMYENKQMRKTFARLAKACSPLSLLTRWQCSQLGGLKLSSENVKGGFTSFQNKTSPTVLSIHGRTGKGNDQLSVFFDNDRFDMLFVASAIGPATRFPGMYIFTDGQNTRAWAGLFNFLPF